MTTLPAMSADLIELAERVEAATGPDRELDALIDAAARGIADFVIGPAHAPGWWSERANGQAHKAPAFTASIDAAMTLVDPSFEVGLIWQRDDREATAVIGVNALAGFPIGKGGARGLNAADALARSIVAAALRSRAALEGGE